MASDTKRKSSTMGSIICKRDAIAMGLLLLVLFVSVNKLVGRGNPPEEQQRLKIRETRQQLEKLKQHVVDSGLSGDDAVKIQIDQLEATIREKEEAGVDFFLAATADGAVPN